MNYGVSELRPYTSRTITDPEALEAELQDVGGKGYAVEVGERFERFWGLAVPVLRSENRLLLAMLCVGVETLTPELLEKTRAQMLATVDALADHLALVGDLPKPAVDFARHNLE